MNSAPTVLILCTEGKYTMSIVYVCTIQSSSVAEPPLWSPLLVNNPISQQYCMFIPGFGNQQFY